MAATKDRAAFTQLTASGTSGALDVSTAYRASLYLRHYNGTGTVTVGASLTIQVKASGGTMTALRIVTGSLTTSAYDQWVIMLPDDATSVQVVYVAPTGASGYTLDGEVGRLTA
jgi:hypothetical protein